MDQEQAYNLAYKALRSNQYELARSQFQALAAAGSTNAWVSLGWMHEHAKGAPKNLLEAENCYKRAVELGSPIANFYLARLLIPQRRYARAHEYFLVAAERGHVPSIYWIGRNYLLGRGVERNASIAESYLKDAMSRGHIFARRDYYRSRLRGEFGSRQFFDWGRWVLSLIAGIRLSLTDPHSEFLQ
jgi:TPR repeat protein